MAARIDKDELRSLVRQALKDALGAPTSTEAKGAPAASGAFARELRAALAKGKPAKIAIAVRSGADLDRFARDLVEASAHADLKAAIRGGDLRFDLAGATDEPRTKAAPAAAAKPAVRGGAFQMNSGVLSEAKIVEIARTHGKILVGSNVVMTPLARDKAREMKVELVRQKP